MSYTAASWGMTAAAVEQPMVQPTESVAPPRFIQPRPWLRWLAVVLAALGWYVSLELLFVSAGAEVSREWLQAVCGGVEGEADGCTEVLATPEAYWEVVPGLRLPVSLLGMGYFSLVGLWYGFVGPTTRDRSRWHLLIALMVFFGFGQSLYYIGLMAFVLHRWCGGCLLAHAVNLGLLLVTLFSWPRRAGSGPSYPHPSGRLACATLTMGVLAFALQAAVVLWFVVKGHLEQRAAEYANVLNDPEFVLWDFHRQPEVSIPLREDEVFVGDAGAENTIVVFGDFQCPHCRAAHETVAGVVRKHVGRARVAYRHYPQDAACNAKYRGGGHASACRAARAVEAARLVGGDEAAIRLRKLIYDRRDRLPTRPSTAQNDALFVGWAEEMGLDPGAFEEAMTSPAATARIAADIALADDLGLQAMPVVFLNGKRLRNWRKTDVWDVLLSGPTTTAPTAGGPAGTAESRPSGR